MCGHLWSIHTYKEKQKQVKPCLSLTSDCEFSCSPDHKTTKLDFTGIIPNVVFLYLLDRQYVSLQNDAGAPLLRTTFLCMYERFVGQMESTNLLRDFKSFQKSR